MKVTISIIFICIIVGIFILTRLQKPVGMDEKQNPIQHAVTTAVNTMKDVGQTDVFNTHMPAPELTGITAWLNSPRANGEAGSDQQLTLQELRGKVVLIDFWTNQCINCIHTLPYVTKWYDTYHDQGFVVIGVHTPELAYERTIGSITDAIKTYGIHYPVAQDNDYATWNAYNNEYWPGFYLIDKKGIIRRTHFGEGEYDQTEKAIQLLLKESV